MSLAQLNRILIEAAAEQPGVELSFHQRCLDLDPQSGTLQLVDELRGQTRSETCEIVLGADGAGSGVRGALAMRGLSQVHEMPLSHDYKELEIPPAPGSAH